ncbi:MAG: UbiD family decarboxylase [Thermincola sp.]|jgi:4-hydroxy-3-polyprenylbenzoate decarboxylase|nr:UbiD family decarboxylase [Thermincola sp.]MDT3704126.1 UbiD family decarboxylase [Thermincola sp.]
MPNNGIRDYIAKLEREGELARVSNEVDWDLELGAVVRETMERGGPALLFENIKDYKDTLCRKFFTNSLSTYARIALMLNLPKDTPYKDLIGAWRERTKKPLKPVIVNNGPCKENILKGDDIDLLQFCAPRWQKGDGGRYIGTFHGVVTKDPDTGWVNVGMYRMMIHDKNTTTMSVAQGQHIWAHWRKYRKRGENIPCAVVLGADQVLPAVASAPIPMGVDEYEIAGALRGAPVELVKCETVDLYVPASSEIVLEGEIITDRAQFIPCGPFGEFTGHYGPSNLRPRFKVNCITFRNDPILQGTLDGMPINEDHRISSVNHSAAIWDLLDERMTGVTGVNNEASAYANLVIQIDNSYYGQVHQAAANVWSSHLSNMMAKNIIVCDTDVDIYDLNRVFWALGYRVDPERDIIKFPGWISALDPVVHPSDVLSPGGNKGIRLLIDATKPIDKPRAKEYGGEKFAAVAYPDDESMKKVRENWARYGIQTKK